MLARVAVDLSAAVLVAVGAWPVAAQSPYVVRRPDREWRTAETAHWAVHYPREAAAFAECLVPQLEAIHAATSAVVGWSPATRITLVIDDPASLAGGFASANARAPVILLNTQPSDPRTNEYSDCATMRVVHELAHVLQLSRPWHAGWQRAILRLLPAEPGPLLFQRRPWLREGYAEHVEGRVTTTGRQYLASRPAAIRALALAGAFPPYHSLDDSYDTRYLVGGAFIDWLAAGRGDSALGRLWARLGASDARGLRAELEGIFDAAPESLYTRYAEVTGARADEVRRRLDSAGLARGDLVRHFAWADGPAMSPDGSRIAVVTGSPVAHVMIWRTGDSTAWAMRLPQSNGQPPNAPRFTRDGRRLLIVSWDLIGAGVWRPDLLVWDLERRRLRRVTRGAGIRDADPTPDGASAIATRCEWGVCDLVRVDLAGGRVSVVAPGSPTRAFARPRVSPDGRRAAVAVQSGARVRVALVDLATGALRYADPEDGAWRYEPAWMPDGGLVVVSEASGVANLELVEPATREARPLTRVVTGAYAPEPDPRGGGVYYLLQTASGFDLHRVAQDDAPRRATAVRDSALAPAAPVPLPEPAPPPFARQDGVAMRAYGLGPRWYSVLAVFSASAEGVSGGAGLWTSDIVGRLSAMLQGSVGEPGTWQGGSLAVAWRGSRLPVFADLAALSHRPSRQGPRGFVAQVPDVKYRGVVLATETDRGPWVRRRRVRVAAGAGRVEAASGDEVVGRLLGAAEYSEAPAQVGDPFYAVERVSLGWAAGRTGSAAWGRWVAAGSVEVGRLNRATLLMLEGTYGETTRGAPPFERFALGGAQPVSREPFALAQRLTMPALPAGVAAGRRAVAVRVAGPRVGPLSPVAWAGSAGERLHRWHRVVGVERVLSDDPRRNWRVPGAQFAAGVGYSLDPPLRGRLRGHASLSFRQ